ncbi:MAG: TadE/TadG family type IV pilus assembly protein [Nitrospinota bacterium]
MTPVRNKRGNVAVECALVIPILLTLFMGIVEFSRLLYTQQILSHATNLSARTGATSLDDTTSQSRAVTSANDALQGGGLDPARADIAVNIYPSPIPGEVEVIATYQQDLMFTFFSNVLGFPPSYTLSAQQAYRR